MCRYTGNAFSCVFKRGLRSNGEMVSQGKRIEATTRTEPSKNNLVYGRGRVRVATLSSCVGDVKQNYEVSVSWDDELRIVSGRD